MLLPLLASLITLSSQASAIKLDVQSKDSICDAAAIIADGALNYYSGLGTFASPSPWWEYGVAFGSLLNYQHLCQNDTYESLIYAGLLSQAGEDYNYEPAAQRSVIGNDDIGAWALTVMQAAEIDFKSPEDDGYPSWLQLAENTFNLLYGRWDDSTCNGGLRWQFDSSRTSDYNYKATIANANLFQLSARLARFTGNSTYTDISEQIYDWIWGAGLVNELEYGAEVYDGFYTTDNCTARTEVLWSYNYGTLIAGAAYLYDVTNDDTWSSRAEQIILGSQALYNDTVLNERACAINDSCNTDQRVFKAVYSRFLGVTSKLIPSLSSKISALVQPSAKGAAKSCSGGSDGVTCGQNWNYEDGWDGKYGLGEQLSALEVIQSLLVDDREGPLKADN